MPARSGSSTGSRRPAPRRGQQQGSRRGPQQAPRRAQQAPRRAQQAPRRAQPQRQQQRPQQQRRPQPQRNARRGNPRGQKSYEMALMESNGRSGNRGGGGGGGGSYRSPRSARREVSSSEEVIRCEPSSNCVAAMVCMMFMFLIWLGCALKYGWLDDNHHGRRLSVMLG